jgi:hypothetical protein
VDNGEARCDCDSGYLAEALTCVPLVVDQCEGEDCSGHGTCVESQGEPSCNCDQGYLTVGLSCIEDGERHLVNAEWSFDDDFEGAEDTTFWGDDAWVEFGVPCTRDPAHTSNVLRFRYLNREDFGSDHSWSEQRFHIPIDAVQLEISYDLFVPGNYVHSPGNQKSVVVWSGPYGTSNANISIKTENWPTDNGATPSVHIGVDGTDYGHSTIPADPLMLIDGYGQWQRIHVYVELAEGPGDFGIFELRRDGVLITGTHHPDVEPSWTGTPVPELISYATRGNFLDQGYLLGWANGGFAEETVFCIDNFSIRANSVIQP